MAAGVEAMRRHHEKDFARSAQRAVEGRYPWNPQVRRLMPAMTELANKLNDTPFPDMTPDEITGGEPVG